MSHPDPLAGRDTTQRARRGSTSSLAGDPSFLWEAHSVTPAAYLEAETTWRNTLGAQQIRRGRVKRSKSTGAIAVPRVAVPPEPAWTSAGSVPGLPATPLELSFWGMVGRELGWGSVFKRSYETNRPSSHIANFMSVPLRMERFVSFGHLVAVSSPAPRGIPFSCAGPVTITVLSFFAAGSVSFSRHVAAPPCRFVCAARRPRALSSGRPRSSLDCRYFLRDALYCQTSERGLRRPCIWARAAV